MPTYSLEDADKWLNVVAASSRDATLRGLLSAAHRTVAYIQTSIIPNLPQPPVGRGAYRAAWRAVRLDNGAEVVNSTVQAIFIEYGVRAENVKPGRAMIAALTEWVRMKGIGGTVVTNKTGQQRLKRVSVDEAESIAWAIARSMQKRGIFNRGNGLRVMERAGRMVPGFIKEEVMRELRKVR